MNNHRVEDELARLLEESEQIGLELIPEPTPNPDLQPAMGGADAAAQLIREVLPSDASHQNEPGHSEGGAGLILRLPHPDQTGYSDGTRWGKASKNTSGIWKVAMAIILKMMSIDQRREGCARA